MDVVRIPLAETKRFGGRDVSAVAVRRLMESMSAIGLLNPIMVSAKPRQDGPTEIATYWVIAGQHRAQAARELGWTEIDAVVVDMDAPHAELCEIDENLVREDLSDVARARAHARRKEIMVSLGLAAVPGQGGNRGNQHTASEKSSLGSYAKQAASDLGVSKRTVEKDIARGEKIAPAVMDKIEGTRLDKGVVLDALAATPLEQQPAKLEAIKAERAETRARTITEAPHPAANPCAELVAAWARASDATRHKFLTSIGATLRADAA